MAHIGPFASEAHAAMRGLPPFNGPELGRAVLAGSRPPRLR
ncbi:hypothetical protein J2S90_003869 [Arthrobacter bambusae]|uniref:Uncharacterized protein n=1 Tax=Arthrobacter bambusae TaxID=1338426 RepID=A0AAW8DKK3_9MICC|nr:hypothetical protein [Arthrobacter bambusae]MDQ0131038.1 hypothetical protein [Arthrobacter bambusae]MDQ0182560.1 hypothetical protein [Arthrobacter bambusae]